MSSADRYLFRAWLIVTLAAACSLFLGEVTVLLMLTIIGMPLAMLLLIMPGTWIYMSVTIGVYVILRLVLRRAAPLLLGAVSLVLALGVGILIPTVANRATEQKVAAILAGDHGAPPALPRGLSITYATDLGFGSPNECAETCQRLLLTQTSSSFVQISSDEVPRLASLTRPALRLFLGPIDDMCTNGGLTAVYASEGEVGSVRPLPLLSDKLRALEQRGLCLHDNTTRDARSDVLAVEQFHYEPVPQSFRFAGDGWRLSLHPIEPFQRRELFRRTAAGWKSLLRRTGVRYARLSVPLWLVPGFSFDTTSPAHWAWENERVVGSPIPAYRATRWTEFLANDLSVTGSR